MRQLIFAILIASSIHCGAGIHTVIRTVVVQYKTATTTIVRCLDDNELLTYPEVFEENAGDTVKIQEWRFE